MGSLPTGNVSVMVLAPTHPAHAFFRPLVPCKKNIVYSFVDRESTVVEANQMKSIAQRSYRGIVLSSDSAFTPQAM